MKKIIYLITLPLLTYACSSENDKADVYGNFEADTYFIAAETAGKLTDLSVSEGDLVQKNQQIGTVDSMQLYFQKKQLQSRVAALKSKLQDVPVQLASLQEKERIITREYNRVKALFADSAATQKQLDDLSGELNVTKKQLEATKSTLSTANRGLLAEIEPLDWQIQQISDQLLKTVLKAPSAGTVLDTYKEPGELVMPGQPVAKVADLSTMTLRGYLSENQLAAIKIGQEVTVSVDYADGTLKSFSGSITWISAKAEFTPKTIQTKEERVNLVYAVKIAVKNDGALKIGMPGEATLN